MKVVNLSCNQCGASLEVGARTRFVTCSFCNTRLQIHHSSNAHYSEVLEAIEKKTDALAQDVAQLKRQGMVEEIDRQWARERRKYLMENSEGKTTVPTVAGSLLMGTLAAVFGVFWTIMAAQMGAPMVFSLFGLLFIAAAVVIALIGLSKASNYQAARKRYERRRREAQSP